MPRIKQLRTQLVVQLAGCPAESDQADLIWQALHDIYIAQQIGTHPVHYLDQPTDTRVLETIERIEEDISDKSSLHRPLHAVIEVGAAIEVPAKKPLVDEDAWLTNTIHRSLTEMLQRLSQEATPIDP